MKEIPTSACDILSALGVNHTVRFTNSEFRAMPFRSLFGLGKLLKTYGIDSEAYELKDHALPQDMPLPFFAGVGGRYIVVTEVGADRVEYLDGGTPKTLTRSRFDKLFNGIVMVCYPGDGACEPGYLLHRAVERGRPDAYRRRRPGLVSGRRESSSRDSARNRNQYSRQCETLAWCSG